MWVDMHPVHRIFGELHHAHTRVKGDDRNMIIGGTVNLGGYVNRKFESNVFDTPEECIADVRVSLLLIRDPRVDSYVKKVFGVDRG